MKRAFRVFLFVTVLVGTALALNIGVGQPQFPNIPRLSEIGRGLSSSYLSLDAVMAVFGFIGWLLWIYIMTVTLLRVIARVATRLALPGAAGLVRFSDWLTPMILRRILDVALGGALIVSAVGGSRSADAVETHAPPTAIQAIDFAGNGHKPAPQVEVQLPQRQRLYIVRPGDSLWRIAERELGSGSRWHEIYELNIGRDQPDGRKLREPRLIRPGWQLLIPGVLLLDCPPPLPTPAPIQSSEPTIEPSNGSASPTPKASPAQTVTIERPIKVELPNGVAVPASFAAGALATSLIQRLRRRRQRRIGDDAPPPIPEPVARAAARVGLDPSIDVIGTMAEAVIQSWREGTGETPRFLAAWEEAKVTSFLIADSPERLPHHVETPTGQHIVFERYEDRVRARVSGPLLPRLRRSPYAAADGVLVPVGFVGDGVLHLPVLGTSLHVSGPSSSLFVATLMKCVDMRLGEDHFEVWTNGDIGSEAEIRMKLELEALRRRRLFSEEGAPSFTEHVLDNPDDQLPIVALIVDSDTASSILDLTEVVSGLGIAVIVKDDEASSDTPRVECDGERLRVHLDGLDPVTVEAFQFPENHSESFGAVADIAAVETPVEAPMAPEDAAEAGVEIQVRAPFEPRVVSTQHVDADLDEAEATRRIYCLGGFRIEVDGELLETGWRSAALEILAALIAYPNGLSRDQLVSMIWPDSEFPQVERLFYTSVSQIRSNLRHPEDTSKIILSSRIEETYRLDLTRVWVDVAEFRESVKAAGTSEDAEALLRRSLDLYGGDFLGEKYYPWAEQVRESLRDAYDDALAKLAELLEARGDFDGSLGLVDRALDHNPLSEDLCRRAMRLAAAAGNRQGVIDRFQRLKTALAKELELEPSDETYEAFNSLVRRPAARRS
jgi:two-component SAPR family response regulator